MCQRVPIPELAEHHHTNDSTGVLGACPALQADSHVTTASIDKALAKGGTETGHRVLMFVTHDFGIRCPNGSQGRRRGVGLLHKDHTEGNKCALPNKVYTVLRHWFENLDGVLKSCSGTGNAKGKCRAAANVGVIALTEELYNPRNLTGDFEEQESESRDRSPANVIRGIRNSSVQQSANSIVIGCPGIGKREGVDAPISKDRILI